MSQLRGVDEKIENVEEELRRSQLDPDAARQVAGGENVDEIMNDLVHLQDAHRQLQKKRSVLNQALALARQHLDTERRKAARMFGAEIQAEYMKIAKRQAKALVELGRSHEEFKQFRAKMPVSVPEAGLPQLVLNQYVAEDLTRTDGRFLGDLKKAVERGILARKDLPGHWGPAK